MIPKRYIQQWRNQAPWPLDSQVEQDLVICRALSEIFSNPLLKDQLAFRGGTALGKIYFQSQYRYSEDIDLVQIRPGRIKPILDALREVLSFL
jgi:predicted nucleotidyltransferase component of viral defense system